MAIIKDLKLLIANYIFKDLQQLKKIDGSTIK